MPIDSLPSAQADSQSSSTFGDEPADTRSALWLAVTLLRGFPVLVRVTLLVSSVVVLVALLLPRQYTSSAAFIPQSSEQLPAGGLAALAGQFGVTIPAGDYSQTPQFYAELVWSRTILEPLLYHVHEFEDERLFGLAGDSVRSTLLDLIPVNGGTEEIRLEKSLDWLRDQSVRVNTSRLTGVVTVTVWTRWPTVSKSIADSLLEALNRFNLESRRSQARYEGDFVEARAAEAETRLRGAESELQQFLERNRSIVNSPALLFERDRLQREVAMRQQIYTTLVEALEQARIAEVRNTPLITTVETPVVAAQAESKMLALVALAAIAMGATVGTVIVVLRAILQGSAGTEGRDSRALAEAWADFAARFRPRSRRG